MTHSSSSVAIIAAVSAVCVMPLTACAERGADTTPAPQLSAIPSSFTATDAPEPPPSKTQAAPSQQDANVAAFAGMGMPALEDQHRMPERLGGLTPTGVRVGAHDGFTRVVVDLEGEGEPGWFTAYTDDPRQQASGYPVEVEGNTFLNLGIEGTPWPSTPELEERYMKPGVTPGTGVVSEVVYTTSFEAQTQLIIGLQKKTPYSVTFLEDPKRLVLDFQD